MEKTKMTTKFKTFSDSDIDAIIGDVKYLMTNGTLNGGYLSRLERLLDLPMNDRAFLRQKIINRVTTLIAGINNNIHQPRLMDEERASMQKNACDNMGLCAAHLDEVRRNNGTVRILREKLALYGRIMEFVTDTNFLITSFNAYNIKQL